MKDLSEAQLAVLPDQLMLYRIDPVSGPARFAWLTVRRELFGGATLVLECGRVGSAGRLVRRGFADQGQAVTALMDTARVLARRGYVQRSREYLKQNVPSGARERKARQGFNPVQCKLAKGPVDLSRVKRALPRIDGSNVSRHALDGRFAALCRSASDREM